MYALVFLLAVTSSLVLRSGDRITVDGTPVEKDGVYTFRSEGTLYSLPASEVARVETEPAKPSAESDAASADGAAEGKKSEAPEGKKSEAPKRKPVSEEERKRLLAELEKNHGGTPPPPTQRPPAAVPPPTKEEVQEQKRDERSWRSEARALDEAVVRANEELELLESRAAELQSRIHALLSQGYKPSQFTYDTTQLQRLREQIPYARLEVQRATRARDQFREDARREGIMPGWLR